MCIIDMLANGRRGGIHIIIKLGILKYKDFGFHVSVDEIEEFMELCGFS